ncbi:hypothetical protein AVEN_136189-1 [Araneus ventricosus]|uniref:Uncharacterized protein n=1 Tax=Araneus ventricosus TaxID=182803 RepID=A0A4Y2RAP2_ARAVE|nr:hypothetical protein AVEN_136189-1 [Araneus ventricosus]
MLTNLHVLDLPESEKDNFGIMSDYVSGHDNSKTIRATGMKFVPSANIRDGKVAASGLEVFWFETQVSIDVDRCTPNLMLRVKASGATEVSKSHFTTGQ